MASPSAGDAGPDAALEALLAQHPTARISAVTGDGTPVPVPPEVPLGKDHVLSGTAGMKAYVPHDRPALIDVFERVLANGHAWGTVHMLHDPSIPLTVHMFDTREQYGVILAVGVTVVSPSAGSREVLAAQPVVRSRLARVYKSRTAQILGIDHAITDILGWSSEDMVGKRSLEFIHPDDQGLAIESWAVLLTEPDAIRRVRVRHRSSGGSWVWFDVAHSASSWEGEPCFVSDMIDVSQEMETQRALEAREQLLAQLAQALPLGVFQMDAEQQFLYTNDCLFQMMGTTGAADFAALLQWVSPVGRKKLQRALQVVMSKGTDTELSVLVEPPDDSPRVCQFTLRRLTSPATDLPGAVGCVVDTTEQTALRRELEDRATYDPLTRCYNRASIISLLDRTLANQRVEGAPTCTAVLFIDLDRFKEVNDRFGHHIGDEFLDATAARIRGGLRNGAVLGRLGGDEFLVVLPAVQSEAEAMTVAQRIVNSLSEDVSLSIGTERSGASIGLAIQTGATTAEALINQADTAMYLAKARGGGQVTLAQPQALPEVG